MRWRDDDPTPTHRHPLQGGLFDRRARTRADWWCFAVAAAVLIAAVVGAALFTRPPSVSVHTHPAVSGGVLSA